MSAEVGEVVRAQQRLEAAELKLGAVEGELVAAREATPPDAQRVAEAKVGVAEAKLGVAEARWQAATEGDKAVLQESVKTAQKAYNIVLDAAAPPHGQVASGVKALDREGALVQALDTLREELMKRDAEAREQNSAGLGAILSAVQDGNTLKKPMSEASVDFTKQLLCGLGLEWECVVDNKESGENFTFDWTGGEEKSTPRAIQKLGEHLGQCVVDRDTRAIEVIDMRKKNLLKLRAGCIESTGETDVAIRLKGLNHSDLSEFDFVVGIVELKTDMAKLKRCQELLELVAMSLMSQFGQSVVLLGTDLNTKWEVLFFDSPNHVTVQQFEFGSVAIKFFQEKLQSVHVRLEQMRAVLPPVAEMGGLHLSAGGDQNLDGFGGPNEGVQDTLQDLKALARHFNENYNANVTLPPWVLSSDASGIYS